MSKEKFMNLLSLIALDVFFHSFYPCLINNATNESLLFAEMAPQLCLINCKCFFFSQSGGDRKV